jgi:predicted component of type VI protein secretion system
MVQNKTMREPHEELSAVYERVSQHLQGLLQALQDAVGGDVDRCLAFNPIAYEYVAAANARKAERGGDETDRDAVAIAQPRAVATASSAGVSRLRRAKRTPT